METFFQEPEHTLKTTQYFCQIHVHNLNKFLQLQLILILAVWCLS